MSRPVKRAAAAASGVIRGRSAALAGLLLWLPVPVAAQFSARPVIVDLRTENTVSEATITVRNESEAPLQLRIYAGDFDQAEDGSHLFMEAGTHGSTCADRLELFPSSLALEAGASGEARVRMAPADSSCWSMVFIQSINRNESGLRIAQRIGVKVYGVSTRARADGEVRGISVSSSGPGSKTVRVEFANTGSAPVRPDGELEVRSETGEVVSVVSIRPFSVLPGRVGVATVPLEGTLAPGRYLLIPILDFGGEYLAGGQAFLEVEDP